MKQTLTVAALALIAFTGCASSLPMDGGRTDDHETIVSQCGVGNYTFRYLKEPCRTPADTVVTESDYLEDYEYAEEDSIGLSESSETFAEESIDVTDEVNFSLGSATLSRESREILDDVAWTLKNNDDRIKRVNIEGHTDASGSSAFNQTLSQARAQAVRSYLVRQGVNPSKLTATGYGESNPKFNTSTSTSDELATNRRVDFAVETYDDESDVE